MKPDPKYIWEGKPKHFAYGLDVVGEKHIKDGPQFAQRTKKNGIS